LTDAAHQSRFTNRALRVRVILNPHAGNAEDMGGVKAAKTLWEAHGWHVEVMLTAYAGHAIVLARDAAHEGFDMVVAAGGDGTVNEVINGIARSNTVLAVLPIGTGNVWGREIKLPLQVVDAAQALLTGSPVRLDLGSANGRYFLLMAGVGFDAAVTRAVLPAAKRRFGLIAYAVEALRAASDVRGTRVRLVLDGRPINSRVLMIVIGNSRLYGAFLQITHHASLTDGLLDVAVIKGETIRSAPLHLLSILLRRYHLNPDINYYRAREVQLTSVTPLAVQLDGDPVGTTPMTFRAEPHALQVLVPSWAVDALTGPVTVQLPFADLFRRGKSTGAA
jgi:YegS/Rv2252/BmrU family lipid kinase